MYHPGKPLCVFCNTTKGILSSLCSWWKVCLVTQIIGGKICTWRLSKSHAFICVFGDGVLLYCSGLMQNPQAGVIVLPQT